MSEHLAMYGLANDPYEAPRLKSYVPSANMRPPVEVQSFGAIRSAKLKQLFADCRNPSNPDDPKKPAYVLIRGRNGVGRTEVARQILWQYKEVAGAEKIVVPFFKSHHDPSELVKTWLLKIEPVVREYDANKEIAPLINTVLDAQIIKGAVRRAFNELLQRIDDKFSNRKPKPFVLGFCLDDSLPGFPHSELAEIFSEGNLVVVSVVDTSDDTAPEIYREMERDGRAWILPTSELTADDAFLLAEHCWKRERAADERSPVGLPDIKKIWSDEKLWARLLPLQPPLPLAHMLLVLSKALSDKGLLEKESGLQWPNPKLNITGNDLYRICWNSAETLRRGRWDQQAS